MRDPIDELLDEAFIAAVLDDLVPKISESIMTMSLVPDSKDIDVKFCVELGVSIMLDKPIVALVHKGIEVPPKLAKILDAQIEYLDSDTPQDLQAKFMPILAEFGVLPNQPKENHE